MAGYVLNVAGRGTEGNRMPTEMKTVKVQVPKNAVTLRIVGVMTTKDGLGLEAFEINRDDLCDPEWGDE